MAKKLFEDIRGEFVQKSRISGLKTNNPVIVAFVGTIGSGKSTIARMLKKYLGWEIIKKDDIRVVLRERGRGFSPANTHAVADAMLTKILNGGGNAILDSDFVSIPKRKKLEKFAKRFHARIVYIHVACIIDVALSRLLHARYNPKTTLFQTSTVAVREYMRRLPLHYRWSPGGGRWIPKKLSIRLFAEIKMEEPRVWKRKIKYVAEKLKKM